MDESFYRLEPELILSTIDETGFRTTGELYVLNSYENRVYDLRLEELYADQHKSVIAKFYRPGRWSLAALADEHNFLRELSGEGIPVNCPLPLTGPHATSQATIGEVQGIYFALFSKHRGRMPDEFLPEDLAQVGRLLARIHNVGARHLAHHRPTYDAHYVSGALEYIEDFIPGHLWTPYLEAAEFLLNQFDHVFADKALIRIHGDCHHGNLLRNDQGFFFVDFDDCCNGPVEQDFWMLLSSGGEEAENERDRLVAGYRELRELDSPQWEHMSLLRAMRIIYYSGWVGKRWQDPSFPKFLPNYTAQSYWAEELRSLSEIIQSLHCNS